MKTHPIITLVVAHFTAQVIRTCIGGTNQQVCAHPTLCFTFTIVSMPAFVALAFFSRFTS